MLWQKNSIKKLYLLGCKGGQAAIVTSNGNIAGNGRFSNVCHGRKQEDRKSAIIWSSLQFYGMTFLCKLYPSGED